MRSTNTEKRPVQEHTGLNQLQTLTFCTLGRVQKGTFMSTGGVKFLGENSKENYFSKYDTTKLPFKMKMIARRRRRW